MRWLILSDIHANLSALDAALDDAQGLWDRAVCLGDVVGYGPDPNEVIERIAALGIKTVRGNHDKASCGVVEEADFNAMARAAIEWTLHQLRPENLHWLQTLPRGPLLEDGLLLVHGSVEDEDEYLLSPEEAEYSLRHSPSPITLFGHTHVQGGFLLRNNRVETVRPSLSGRQTSATMRFDLATRYLINPGSVGQPRDGDVRSAFALADTGSGTVEFRRVVYDVESVQERMERAGLPEPLVLRLAFGR